MKRRLAAILAADVVGYSRLMAADEQGTHARLKTLRKDFIELEIAKHHGRVVKLTGDGALVEFPSVVEAVECAAAIQAGVAERQADQLNDRRIVFRIGINIGDVIIEEEDIYGDGVNVAARLEQLAEPGGICIARNVYNQVKNKIAFGFEPMGEHEVKNIPEPVVAYRVLPDPGPVAAPGQPTATAGPPVPDSRGAEELYLAPEEPEIAPKQIDATLGLSEWRAIQDTLRDKIIGLKHAGRPKWHWAALAAAAALVTIAGGTSWWHGDQFRSQQLTSDNIVPAGPLPLRYDKPSIAVLPFENLGGDEWTGQLADGTTEDIITDLARFRDLDVIARNSTKDYKESPVDARQVGENLDVGYVLVGSIQRQEDRVRITAQLIDTRSGAHTWSERWDRPVGDVFAVQGEIAEQVASRLGGAFTEAIITTNEARHAKRLAPKDLTAYYHWVLAADAKAVGTEQAVISGLAHAEQAITLDPTFARAYVARGMLRYILATRFRVAGWDTVIEPVGADLRKAVELDPADAEAHVELGFWYSEKGRMAAAVVEIERALEMNPANIHVLVEAASVLPYTGRVEQAAAVADKAMRLDPQLSDANRLSIKDAYFFTRQFERTVEMVKPVPDDKLSRMSRLALAASYAFLGRAEEAEDAKTLFVDSHPEASAELWLNKGFSFTRQRERDLFVESFRKLGLPICATPKDLAGISKPVRLPECSKAAS
jgi:TolB-like protein/class 3 adenylate cyclase